MKLSEMNALLNVYVDDVVDITTATTLFNAGINKMSIEVKSNLPILSSATPDSPPAFPAIYHEIPVLYAATMIKAQDSSLREKGSFLQQFDLALSNFSENYDPPMQYKDSQNTQQFIAVAGQTTFVITQDTYNRPYANLTVYVNGKEIPPTWVLLPTTILTSRTVINTTITTSNDPNSFTLVKPCVAGDMVTALWEIHAEFERPPVQWYSW